MNPEDIQKLVKTNQELTALLSQFPMDTSYKIVLYIVPIVGIVFGCTLLFFMFFWWYRQRIEMIRAGIYRKEPFDLKTYSFFLGLLLTFVGLALTGSFLWVLGKNLAILGGLIPLALGLGLISYYKFSK